VKFGIIDYIGAASVCFVLVVWAACLVKLAEPYYGETSEPQRYTVHFDGIDYQGLTRESLRGSRSGTTYKTKAGKRIEFHGSFYEVEQ
jgi:hypothetical protein